MNPLTLGTGILNMGMGMVSSKMQAAQQSKLMREQNRQQERLMGISQQYGKDMWDYTNYENQKKHMEAAGLNPALMYGMGGGGGVTTGSQPGGTAASGQAPMPNIGMGIDAAQLSLLEAQKQNIEADTKLKLAGVPKPAAEIKGIEQGIIESGARIENLKADTGNKTADTKLKEIGARTANIAANIAEATEDEQIEILERAATRSEYELDILYDDKLISRATRNEKIMQQKADLANTWADTWLKQEQKRLAAKGIQIGDAQIQKMSNDISQGLAQLNLTSESIKTQQGRLELDKFINDIPLSEQMLRQTFEGSLKAIYGIGERAGTGKVEGGYKGAPPKKYYGH